MFTVVHYAVQFYMQSKSFSLNTLLVNNWMPIPLSSLSFTLSDLHPLLDQWNLGFMPDEFLQIWKGFLQKEINFKFREFWPHDVVTLCTFRVTKIASGFDNYYLINYKEIILLVHMYCMSIATNIPIIITESTFSQ